MLWKSHNAFLLKKNMENNILPDKPFLNNSKLQKNIDAGEKFFMRENREIIIHFENNCILKENLD
jgi:hypothetical protein